MINLFTVKSVKCHPGLPYYSKGLCKSCYDKTWRKSNRDRLLTYWKRENDSYNLWISELKNHPCLDCGQSFPSECMDFDHVNGDKEFHVTQGKRRGRERVIREIAKCDLVCANCHRIRTRKRANI